MSSQKKISVGVVGGTGYTGAELLRLLVRHPRVELSQVTSRAEAGMAVADLFQNLRGHLDLKFSAPDQSRLSDCELVFFATPNGTAMTMVEPLLAAGVRVIDLAADFRLRDVHEWQRWYGQAHACPELLGEAVYGLPEVNRQLLRQAHLVANPGCYPTAIQLGFLPLLEQGLVAADSLIADAKSGISGAGRQANVAMLMAETADSMQAYAVAGHRHYPEICQGLQQATGIAVGLTFVPHLTPMIRGIHATLYATLHDENINLQSIFEQRFQDEPCVDVLPAGSHPATRTVKGANQCRLAVHRPVAGNKVIVLSVIDNLVKGAAGQAIQNMNIMFGFEETAGLDTIALLP